MGSLHSIVAVAVLSGLLVGLGVMLWQLVAPSLRRTFVACVATLALVGLLLTVAGESPRVGMLSWALASGWSVLCWRLVHDRVAFAPRHVALVMGAAVPVLWLVARVFPPGARAEPVEWMLPGAPPSIRLWVPLYFLGLAAPVLVSFVVAMGIEPRLRMQKVILAIVGGVGAMGICAIGVGQASAPHVSRWVACILLPVLATGLLWGVLGPSFWRSGSNTAQRAATAAFMTRIVGKSTERLGRELALARAHAQGLEEHLDRAGVEAFDAMVLALTRGQQLAGALTSGTDRSLQHRSIIALQPMLDRVLLFVGNGNPAVGEVHGAHPERTLWMVASALEHALVALVRNAVDAQKSIGVSSPVQIRLTETGQPFPVPDLLAGKLQHERYLVISVEDCGPGVSPEARERALEPFFTTRDGRDGLGLYSVLNLVRIEGAAFDLHARNGLTRAILWLPLRERPILSATDEAPPPRVSVGDQRFDVIFIDSEGARSDKFGVLASARGLRWASVPGVQALVTQAEETRVDGVIVCLEPLEPKEVELLARWMASRIVSVSGSPETLAALVASGMDVQIGFVFEEPLARQVMGSVERALALGRRS